jgi:hypothetical protein
MDGAQTEPEAMIRTRGLRRPSVLKGVVILVLLSVVAVVIGARQFGRAVS